MTSPPTDVFMSYKAEDRARLAPLVGALEAEGFSVWWDAHIGAGTNWRRDIEEHLHAAKCVIVAWSRRSVGPEGEFVRDEGAWAKRHGTYLPIRLDNVDPPLGFGEVQALSLKGWKGDRADPRFRAVAGAVRSRIAGEKIPHAHAHFQSPRVSRRAAIAGGAGIAVVAAAGGGWLLLEPSAANAKRIAVMPFENLSGDPKQAYFAEGVAEELRGALSRIGLQVIGRASSDAVKDMDTKTAAAKLDVGNFLTGSVRRSPQLVRISAQLVGGKDGVERWQQNYDRAPGDAIKIQTDIAENVAQSLSVALGQAGKAALTLGGTADSMAQDLCFRARHLLNSAYDADSIHQAIGLFDQAIARDPNYANAWRLKATALDILAASGMADGPQTFAQAKAAAQRGIALAPKFGAAYVPLAQIQADQLDYRDAFQNMERALALAPQDSGVLSGASLFLQNFGDPHKALERADQLIALNPLEGAPYGRKGDVLLSMRQYAQAVHAYRRALALAPKVVDFTTIGDCFMLMNRPSDAKIEYAKAPADDPLRLTSEAIMAIRAHDSAGMDRAISRMRALFGSAASFQYAEIYAQAVDANRAFAELDNAVRLKDPGLQSLKVDAFLDPIRSDPRFADLLKRLNFPTWT